MKNEFRELIEELISFDTLKDAWNKNKNETLLIERSMIHKELMNFIDNNFDVYKTITHIEIYIFEILNYYNSK